MADPDSDRVLCRPTGASVDPTAPGTVDTDRTEPSRSPRVQAGDRVGRYRLLEPLGKGGMGTVFRARDPELGRDVALKVLHAGEAEDRILLSEARALATLCDPNVVAVFGVVRTPSRQWALVMELVEGPSLQQWLIGAHRDPDEVLDVFVAAGRGLVAAHAAGIVHCDFKPANVLLGEDGRVRVTDFGLATATGTNASGEAAGIDGLEATMAVGRLAGTPAYMAPEQHLGGTIDARTDQFAFCAALCEALTGVRPYGGRTLADLLRAKLTCSRDEALRRLPRRLRAVLRRGLSPRPDERFASMAELVAALQLARRPVMSRRAWSMVTDLAGGLLRTREPQRSRGFGGRPAPRTAAVRRRAAAAHRPR